MSLYIDQKYLMILAPRLAKFKKKSDRLFNCRCPLCGDSQSNVNKARGYFYVRRNDLFYKCHNCGASKHFGTFLKEFDSVTYKSYVFERYAKGNPEKKAHSKAKTVVQMVEPFSPARTFERVAQRLDTLPTTHLARQYCKSRGIPAEKLPLLYVLDIAEARKLAPHYDEKRLPNGPARLAMPLYNGEGTLVGLSLRTLQDEELRYIMIRFDEKDTSPMFFGLPSLDKTKPVYVVEGAIDSLFLPNAIACNGVSFDKAEALGIPRNKLTLVIDNEPRNKEVCRVYNKMIDLGYRVVVWPETVHEKDINEMVSAGLDVTQLIQENTKQGLRAQAAFMQWRRC